MKKTLFTIALPEEKICLPESDDISELPEHST